MFRLPIMVLVIASAGTGLAGCAYFDDAPYKETRALQAPWTAGQALTVETRNGSIEVVPSPGPEVRISATLRAKTEERLRGAEVVSEAFGPSLALSVRWPEGGPKGSEGCAFVVEMPAVAGVKATTSNGSVKIAGSEGAVVVNTSNGAVEVRELRGSADIDTSNGRVTVSGAPTTVSARSSNGSVRVVGSRGNVLAHSSNGGIDVELAPDGTGPVDLESSNGRVALRIGATFRSELELDTSNGSLNVHPPAAQWLERERRSGRVLLNGGGPRSRIRTSNGSITVE